MDQQTLNLVMGTALTVLGWFARELWSAVKELKNDLSHLREQLPKTYVYRDDYKSDIQNIKNIVQRIFDKLEEKADK